MKKKLLFLCVLLLSVFVVVGCDKSNNKKEIVGKYDIVEAIEGETTIKGGDLEKYGIKYTLTVKSNGTAFLVVDDDKETLKYDDKYFYTKENKSDKVPYTYSKGKLTLSEDGLSMIFKKK